MIGPSCTPGAVDSYLNIAGCIVVPVCLLVLAAMAESAREGRALSYFHFFLLGTGFLLLETKPLPDGAAVRHNLACQCRSHLLIFLMALLSNAVAARWNVPISVELWLTCGSSGSRFVLSILLVE